MSHLLAVLARSLSDMAIALIDYVADVLKAVAKVNRSE